MWKLNGIAVQVGSIVQSLHMGQLAFFRVTQIASTGDVWGQLCTSYGIAQRAKWERTESTLGKAVQS